MIVLFVLLQDFFVCSCYMVSTYRLSFSIFLSFTVDALAVFFTSIDGVFSFYAYFWFLCFSSVFLYVRSFVCGSFRLILVIYLLCYVFFSSSLALCILFLSVVIVVRAYSSFFLCVAIVVR